MVAAEYKDKKEIVKMSNSLAEAKYKLDLQAQKIYLYAVSKISEDNKDFNTIKFHLKDYAKSSNSDIKQLYKDIDKITDNLMSAFFKIKHSKETWEKYHIMKNCKYNNGEVIIMFDKDMKPFLLELKNNYSRHWMDVSIRFKNKYSIRIYQILQANKYKIEKHNLKYIDFEFQEFREMIGIEKKQYMAFNNFRVRVLEKAKKEINSESDIEFTYEKITYGRKVIGLKFFIKEKIVVETELGMEDLYKPEEIESMKINSGLEKENFNATQIIELYGIACMKISNEDVSPFEYIRINYLNMINIGTARSNFSWLKKALENDFASAIVQISLKYQIHE